MGYLIQTLKMPKHPILERPIHTEAYLALEMIDHIVAHKFTQCQQCCQFQPSKCQSNYEAKACVIAAVHKVLVTEQGQLGSVSAWYASLQHEVSYAVFDQQQNQVQQRSVSAHVGSWVMATAIL